MQDATTWYEFPTHFKRPSRPPLSVHEHFCSLPFGTLSCHVRNRGAVTSYALYSIDVSLEIQPLSFKFCVEHSPLTHKQTNKHAHMYECYFLVHGLQPPGLHTRAKKMKGGTDTEINAKM